MAGFNYTFGGQLVEPSQLSYLAFAFPFPGTPNPNQLVLNWPVSFIDSLYIAADILDITPSAGGQSVVLPPANQVSNGQQILLNNIGAFPITIYLNDATTVLLTIPNGMPSAPTSYYIYLTNNTTTNVIAGVTYYIGTWRTVPFAGGTTAITSINATSNSNNLVIGGVPITSAGTITFTLANDLFALTQFGAGTGYAVRTAANTWALNTFGVTNANLTLTNPSGAGGNTVYGLNNVLTGLTSVNVGTFTIAASTISSTSNTIFIDPTGPGANINLDATVQITSANSLIFYNTLNNQVVSFMAQPGLLNSQSYILPPIYGNLGDTLGTNGVMGMAQQMAWQTVPGRNRLINGDFQVWQRNTTFPLMNSVTYGADRWQFTSGPVTAATFSQGILSSGNFTCIAQRNNANAGTGIIGIANSLPIGDCTGIGLGADFNNHYVTVSFKARCGATYSSAGSLLTASLVSGTGNTNVSNLTTGFAGATTQLSQNAVLTTSFQNFTYTTAALPNNITQLYVSFAYAPTGVAGISDYFEITDIQVELSMNQTPFDRIGFAATLQKCYPFYQKTFAQGTVPAQNTGANTGEQTFTATVAGAITNSSPSFNFIVPMRTAPNGGNNIITTYSPGAVNDQVYDETSNNPTTATTQFNIAARGFYLTCVGNAATTLGAVLGVHYTADAELY